MDRENVDPAVEDDVARDRALELAVGANNEDELFLGVLLTLVKRDVVELASLGSGT